MICHHERKTSILLIKLSYAKTHKMISYLLFLCPWLDYERTWHWCKHCDTMQGGSGYTLLQIKNFILRGGVSLVTGLCLASFSGASAALGLCFVETVIFSCLASMWSTAFPSTLPLGLTANGTRTQIHADSVVLVASALNHCTTWLADSSRYLHRWFNQAKKNDKSRI